MKETRSGRMSWIKESKPQVPVILHVSEFPYLRNNKIVSDSAWPSTVKHEQLYCIGHGAIQANDWHYQLAR